MPGSTVVHRHELLWAGRLAVIVIREAAQLTQEKKSLTCSIRGARIASGSRSVQEPDDSPRGDRDSLRTWGQAARVQAGACTCLLDVARVTARDREPATPPQKDSAAPSLSLPLPCLLCPRARVLARDTACVPASASAYG